LPKSVAFQQHKQNQQVSALQPKTERAAAAIRSARRQSAPMGISQSERSLTGIKKAGLAVVSQDVVPIEAQAGSWGTVGSGGVWSMEVVVVHPGLQFVGSML
jgi:hypothetical protein